MRLLIALALLLAAASLLLVPVAPGYDAWAWLLWGREVSAGALSTAEGPAFKPLPVGVCALLAPLGPAAPLAWVAIARAGAIAAVAAAYVLARRLAGGSRLAGAVAALGVAFAGGFLALAGEGNSEGLLVACALGGALAWSAGRPRAALALAAACALVRVEAWPFALAAAAVHWRRAPEDRALLAAGALAVPALWFVPELLGSGDLWRSAARARVPNPGQPALAAVPALESLRQAAALPLVPVALAALALLPRARRHAAALVPAAAGMAWLLVVAAMSQAGFSGEPRYALPGIAVAAVTGGVGLARLRAVPRAGPLLAAGLAAAAALAAAPRAADLPAVQDRLGYAARLNGDLARAVALAGGRSRLLACGRPAVGGLRGPLLAYRLEVEKHRVAFLPGRAGVLFVSRRTPHHGPAPAVTSGYRAVARAGTWRVLARCGDRAASS